MTFMKNSWSRNFCLIALLFAWDLGAEGPEPSTTSNPNDLVTDNDGTPDHNPVVLGQASPSALEIGRSPTAPDIMTIFNNHHYPVPEFFGDIRISSLVDTNSRLLSQTNVFNLTDCRSECTIETQSFPSLEDLFTSFNVSPPDISADQRCDCLNSHLSKMEPSVTPDEKDRRKEEIQQEIRRRVNMKLLNDYSNHFEDTRYYAQNFANIFNAQEGGARDRLALEAQCSSFDSFRQALRSKQEKCARNGISESEQHQRIKDVLKSFGQNLPPDLDQAFLRVQRSILVSGVRINGQYYDRRQLDQDRYSNSRNDLSFQRPVQLIEKILKDSDVFQRMSPLLHELSPLEAIESFLTLNMSDKDLMDKLISPELLAIYPGIKQALQKTDDPSLFAGQIKDILSQVSSLHPGIERVLSHSDLFNRAQQEIGSKGLQELVEQTDFLNSHFTQKCGEITSNFSDIICSSNSELLSGINPSDLSDIVLGLGENDGSRALLVRAAIACEHNSTALNPYLQKLTPKRGDISNSDLFNRVAGFPNAFTAFANMSKNDELRTILDGNRNIFGSGAIGVARDYVMDTVVGPTGRVASAVVKSLTEESPQTLAEENQPSLAQTPGIAQNFYSTTMTTPAMADEGQLNGDQDRSEGEASSREEGMAEWRRSFADYLKDKEGMDEERANSIVSGASDETMRRLMELREEMQRNQSRIAELTAENERLRLAQMEERIQNLQNQRAALEPADAPGAQNGNSSGFRNQNFFQPVFSNLGRPQLSTADTGGASTGGSVSTGPAQSASLSDSLSGEALAASRGASRGPASDASANPVVVSASTARSGSLEIRSQEVGLDLLNYLSSNGSDLQTLINLKTSGIIYRYREMENGQYVEKEVLIEYNNLNEDVKRIIDKKIAENSSRESEIVRLDNEILELRRVYSYSALQFILAEQMQNNPGRN